MIPADLSSSIHGWAERAEGADWVMTVAAQDLLYLAAAILVALWFRPAALRAGLAAGLGSLLALGVGAALGQLHPESRPFVADHFVPLFPHDADGSFPSDHLAVLGAITAGAWLGSRRLGFLIGVACALLVWVALTPATPVIERFDGALQACHLRPGPKAS